MRRFALVLLALSFAVPAHAGHYASLRSNKVYLREGPTFQHRILFIYERKDYPVDVLASYEVTFDSRGQVTGYRRTGRFLRSQVEDR